MPILSTASEVIDALGGTAVVARLTKRSQQSVTNWRANGRIAPGVFLIMREALEQKGLQASPSIWGITEPERV